MNIPNRQTIERIADYLRQNGHQGETELNPDYGQFTVIQIQGYGATSTNYQVRFAGEQGGSRNFFVKKFNDEGPAGLKQLATEYKTAKWLATELGDKSSLFVDAPILMIPEDRTLVTAYVAGENLSPYFFNKLRWRVVSKGDESDLKALARRMGAGLAGLQNIPVDRVQQHFDRVDPAQIYAGFETELDKYLTFYSVRNLCSELVVKAIRQVEDCLQHYLFNDPRYCFQHNDYILQNFIFGDDRKLYLFDFANSTIGIPYFDMAHLMNSLEDLTYLKTVSQSLVSQLKNLFLQPLLPADDFQPRLLAAMQAYIQIYSGTILLSGAGVSKKTLLRSFVMADPEERFKKKLLALLDEIGNC